jgi:hypothetical protein
VFGDPYSGRWRNPWNEGGLVTDCKVMMGSYHYMSQDNRYDYDTVNEWIVKGCLKSQGARWNRWETNINFLGGQIGYPTGNVPYPAIVVVETRSGIVGEGDILAAIFDIGFSLNESVGSHCFLHTTHYAIATPAQGWHVLRVDLTAYYIRWYIDGVQVAEHIGGYEFACALTFNWVPSVGGGMPLLSYPDTRSDAELDYVYYRQV